MDTHEMNYVGHEAEEAKINTLGRSIGYVAAVCASVAIGVIGYKLIEHGMAGWALPIHAEPLIPANESGVGLTPMQG